MLGQHLVNPGLELCVDLLPLFQVCCVALHRLQPASTQRRSSSAPQPAAESSHGLLTEHAGSSPDLACAPGRVISDASCCAGHEKLPSAHLDACRRAEVPTSGPGCSCGSSTMAPAALNVTRRAQPSPAASCSCTSSSSSSSLPISRNTLPVLPSRLRASCLHVRCNIGCHPRVLAWNLQCRAAFCAQLSAVNTLYCAQAHAAAAGLPADKEHTYRCRWKTLLH